MVKAGNVIVRYVTICVTGLLIALTGTSLFTNYWIEIEAVKPIQFHVHRGLLQWVCNLQVKKYDINCQSTFSLFPSWLKSVFLCMCVTFGLQIFQLFMNIMTASLKTNKTVFAIICTCSAFVNFILLSVAIGVFAGKSNYLYFQTYVFHNYTIWCQLGWSYWIAIMAVVISIVSTTLEGILIFLVSSNSMEAAASFPPEAMATWKFTM